MLLVCLLLIDQQEQPPQSSSSTQDDTAADASERRNTLLAIGFAFMAMSVYALYSGLIQIEIIKTGDSHDFDLSTPEMSQFNFRDEEQNNENTAG